MSPVGCKEERVVLVAIPPALGAWMSPVGCKEERVVLVSSPPAPLTEPSTMQGLSCNVSKDLK